MQCGPSSAALKCPGCGGAASGRDQCWSLVLVFTLQLTLRLKFPVEGHASNQPFPQLASLTIPSISVRQPRWF